MNFNFPFFSSVYWRFLIHKLQRKFLFCLYLNLRVILDCFLPYPTYSLFSTSCHLYCTQSLTILAISPTHPIPGPWIYYSSLFMVLPPKIHFPLSCQSDLTQSADYISHMLKTLQWLLNAIRIKPKLLNMVYWAYSIRPLSLSSVSLPTFFLHIGPFSVYHTQQAHLHLRACVLDVVSAWYAFHLLVLPYHSPLSSKGLRDAWPL